MKKIKINSNDLFIYKNEIAPYLPEKIFDAHSHLCIAEFHDYQADESDPFFYNVDMNDLENSWETLFPDSQVNGLIMGMPVYNCNLEAENKYIAQTISEKNCFSLMIKPQMSSEELNEKIKRFRPAGLKPYLVHAAVQDKQQAGITDFISEEQLALADKYGLAVTLHVSKPRGMADEENLADISRLIKQFPKVQFILAHCGRNFIAPNMAATLDSLPVAENLWFDTSAVCDTGVFLELFSRYDLSRILFGTDLVNAAAFRGNYIRLGMSWHAVTPQMLAGAGGLESKATYALYQNLSALFHAAKFCRLDKQDIQNVFYNNAAKLFKL
jgi:glutamate-1-semialdehyde 2,1-aminomutase